MKTLYKNAAQVLAEKISADLDAELRFFSPLKRAAIRREALRLLAERKTEEDARG